MRGQVAHTVKGPKFVEGETVMTPDGLKFVVGVSVVCTDNSTVGSKFVCGTLIDAGGERAQFMQVRERTQLFPGNAIALHIAIVLGMPKC